MSRLIDADELANKVADLYTEGEEATEADKVVNDVIDLIDNAPTVEPQKIVTIPPELIEKLASCVVDIVGNIDWEKAIEAYKARPQGEWITRTEDNGVNYHFYCSCCDREVIQITDYCPNCGADMKGGRE